MARTDEPRGNQGYWPREQQAARVQFPANTAKVAGTLTGRYNKLYHCDINMYPYIYKYNEIRVLLRLNDRKINGTSMNLETEIK